MTRLVGDTLAMAERNLVRLLRAPGLLVAALDRDLRAALRSEGPQQRGA
jgi:hypothetical protein